MTNSRMMYSALSFLLSVAFAAGTPMLADNFHDSELKQLFGVDNLHDAPEYEIIYPKYVTDDVTRGICSDAIVGDSLNINIDAFGNNLKLVVHQDSSLFSEDFYAEKIQENGQPVPLSVRTDCFYTGEVESEPDSMISLSTCSGLNAIVYHANGPTVIEPLTHDTDNSRGRAHVAYKQRSGRTFNCGTSVDFSQGVRSPSKKNTVHQEAQKTLELGVFVTDDNSDKTEAATLTVIQAIKVFMEKPSLGTTLKLKCVSLIIFGGDGPAVPANPYKALRELGNDQLSRNVEDDADPKHWDNALYLVGKKMFDARDRHVQGIAHINAGGYDLKAVAIATWDTGVAEVAAHELGHNLGMRHDGADNTCPRSGFIMTVGGELGATEWSTCSKAEFDTRMGETTVYDD
ncbi:A disintegrin and metalloproteinase with thrombospondin motifs adt-1-like [Asterias rubens]|uniref:A disintegrin and metalloproteinase with thrombospondin motifs adt-1-like n=1 Tax=Asterias rubens TaxID=7604 RepID=UPI001455B0FB|nr:A disintegrin and metalloproteinase with thrombospondin motifs adt-1-like [Asterias rubens]